MNNWQLGWIKRKEHKLDTPWNKGKKLGKSPKNTRLFKKCLECSNSFEIQLYRKDTAHFCSHDCSAKYRNEGKRTKDKVIRQSWAYKAWRTLVFERDDYTCQDCGIKNEKGLGRSIILHADHIKPFALYPELRFDINNGRTLCINCHKQTMTWGRGAIYREVGA